MIDTHVHADHRSGGPELAHQTGARYCLHESADVAKTIAQVLFDDLSFEREFYMIPRDTYASVPVAQTVDQVPFAAWREIGADAVAFGTVQRSGANVQVQLRLFNVRTRQSVFAQEYTGSAANARLYANEDRQVLCPALGPAVTGTPLSEP